MVVFAFDISVETQIICEIATPDALGRAYYLIS